MTYETYSSAAPQPSGDITAGEINRIPANPLDADSSQTLWPSKLDQFANKNNADMEAFVVTDEVRDTAEIDVGDSNALYLHHKILAPDSATGSSILSVSDGALTTGLTDFQAGKIHFSVMPTGSTTVISYTAAPDAIHSVHLNVLQDAVMKLQTNFGITADVNQGIMNAQFLLYGTAPTGALAAAAPNVVPVGAFTQSGLTIAGVAGLTHGITLGNSYDAVGINASSLVVHASGGYEATTGSYPVPGTGNATAYLHTETHLMSQTTIGQDWPANAIGLWSASGQYTGAGLRVLGDVFIAGNLTVTGSETILASQVTITGNFVQQNLDVSGNAGISGNATILGDLSVGGGLSADTFTINSLSAGNSIAFTNANSQVTTVDGLDPSYWNDHLEFMHRDPAINSVVMCPWKPMIFTEYYDPNGLGNMTGTLTRSWTGQVVNKISDSSGDWIYGSIPLTYTPAGIFDDGIFDGELKYGWNSGPVAGKEGVVIEVESFTGLSGTSTGCRFRMSNDAHYGVAQIGNLYSFYWPGHQYTKPNFIMQPTKPAGIPVVEVQAHNSAPLVLNIDGQLRKITQAGLQINMTEMLTSPPANGDYTGYIYTSSVRNVYQSYNDGAPAFYALPYNRSVPGEMILGEIKFTRSAAAWGNPGDWVVTHYAPDSYFDTGWILTYAGIAGTPIATNGITHISTDGWGNGHLKEGPDPFTFSSTESSSDHIVLEHNIGDERKVKHAELVVLVGTTYYKSNPETSNHKFDLDKNHIRSKVHRIYNPQVLKIDRRYMWVALDLPAYISNMWSSWAGFPAPAYNSTAPNGIRAYYRFVIRPVRQSDVHRQN